ncbi:hypothetical protein D3C87_1744240 [compost metagenome]
MHYKLTDYQTKVLRNAFDGKTIYQIIGCNDQLEDEYFFYPVEGEKYSLPRNRHREHTINKFTLRKLIEYGLIEPDADGDFIITRKGQEQIMGHTNFTAERI